MYIRRKKTTRVTISFKCTDFVKLSLIESTCTFFSFMSFDCAMIFLFLNIVFIFSSMMLQNICLNNSKKILSNSRRRISINVFNISLIKSIEFDCSLMICANFLNLFMISTTSTELNLISFVFVYLIICESELMSIKISFNATFAQEILINFESLLKRFCSSNSLHSNNFRCEYFLSRAEWLLFTFDSLRFERIASMKTFTKLYKQKNHSHIA